MAFRYRKLLLFSLLISITDSLILLYWVHYRVKKLSTVFSNGTQSASHSVFLTAKLKSDKRGYIALVYSGTVRSFSANFESHIVNLMAGCPYTVHLFLHTIKNDNRFVECVINSSHDNYLYRSMPLFISLKVTSILIMSAFSFVILSKVKCLNTFR